MQANAATIPAAAMAMGSAVFGDSNDSSVPLDARAQDLELAQRHRLGDDSAFQEFVDTYSNLIYNVAFRMTGHHEDTLDLYQDILLKVHQSLGSFRGQAALSTWTYRITMNAARNHARWWNQAKRGKTYSLDEAEEDHQPPSERVADPSPSSEDRAYGSEIRARIQRGLDLLHAGQRAVVVLRDVEGLDYREIASTLGVSLGTVKSRLSRAREALRHELADLMM